MLDALIALGPDHPQEPLRDKVMRAESLMLQRPQVDLPVEHLFAKGVYARELFIKKDTYLTGKIHKYSQLNILLAGDISVLTENGIERVKPPFRVVSPAGTKRIAYAHEDSIWLTVHGTEETDLEKIEQKFIAQDEQEYLEFCRLQLEEKPCPG